MATRIRIQIQIPIQQILLLYKQAHLPIRHIWMCQVEGGCQNT